VRRFWCSGDSTIKGVLESLSETDTVEDYITVSCSSQV